MVPAVRLSHIHYLIRTAERNIDSSRLEQGITLKIRMKSDFFYLDMYLLTTSLVYCRLLHR